MSRVRVLFAGAMAALTMGALAAPAVQAQAQPMPLPGGSVTLPPIEPVPVAVPLGSTSAQLPALPFPLHWQDPAPLAPPAPSGPEHVASNWIVMYTFCPSPGEWAYTENGTTAWCARRVQTDAYHWAPSPDTFSHPEATDRSHATRVENSLAARDCNVEGATTINPSNGQGLTCEMYELGPNPRLIWWVTDYRNTWTD